MDFNLETHIEENDTEVTPEQPREMSFEEIAAKLGLSVAEVREVYDSAMNKMRLMCVRNPEDKPSEWGLSRFGYEYQLNLDIDPDDQGKRPAVNPQRDPSQQYFRRLVTDGDGIIGDGAEVTA